MTPPAALKQLGAWILLHSQSLRLHNTLLQRGRAVVLLYHRINDERDPFFPSLSRSLFATQLDYVARRYRVEPLEQVVEWLACGAKGRPRAAITIDDGYPDTVSAALPELERRGLPATLFLSTAPPETGQPIWTDRLRRLLKHGAGKQLATPWLGLAPQRLDGVESRLRALALLLAALKASTAPVIEQTLAALEAELEAGAPPVPTIGWEHVRRLAAGRVQLGAHTHRHFPLSRLSEAEQEQEIAHSLRLIEERTGIRASCFAYPNGESPDYDARTIGVLRRLGLRFAVTTRHGVAEPGHDPFELPRIPTSEPSLPLFAARLAGLTNSSAGART